MDRSLSYILPVNDGHHGLTANVERLLDMLSDLTPWFELLIVDEGSCDVTAEILHDLAQRYPQVKVFTSGNSLNEDLLAAMNMLNGEIVFVADRDSQPVAGEIRKLWNMRHESQLIMARVPQGPDNLSDDLITRLMSWGEALRNADEPHSRSVRMIRRSAMMRLNEQRQTAALAY